MEIVSTVHEIISGNRHLTITKSKDSVDIRITKYAHTDKEKIEEDLNIPISMNTYYSLVNEMIKDCQESMYEGTDGKWHKKDW